MSHENVKIDESVHPSVQIAFTRLSEHIRHLEQKIKELENASHTH